MAAKKNPGSAGRRTGVVFGDGVIPSKYRKTAEKTIDFSAINAATLACLGPVLTRLAPGGKVIAGEFVACNPCRADKRAGSFKVRMFGQRAGAWCYFATGDRGGDPVSLVAYLESCTQGEAARKLAGMLGIDIGGRGNG